MRFTALFSALIMAAIPSLAGSFLIGAIEDTPGASGFEQNGDFNDFVFSIAGNASIVAPGGFFTPLTSAVPSGKSQAFWDNASLGNKNIGYCLMNDPACLMPGIASVQYLSGLGGLEVPNQTFTGIGPLTFTILGQFTTLAAKATLGYCDPLDCFHTQHVLLGLGGASNSATFTPTGAFELYFTNGIGQFYGSQASDNVNETARQQHFALFLDPPAESTPASGSGSGVPEPSTIAFLTIGLGALIAAAHFTTRHASRDGSLIRLRP